MNVKSILESLFIFLPFSAIFLEDPQEYRTQDLANIGYKFCMRYMGHLNAFPGFSKKQKEEVTWFWLSRYQNKSKR